MNYLTERLKRALNKITSSDFIRNIITLMAGTTFAQIISLLFLPLLTRLYTPEEFGYLAIYMSTAKILSTVSTGRYELAVMLPKEDKGALNLMFLSMGLVIITALITFIVLLFYKNDLLTLINVNENRNLFFFLPLSILFLGFYQNIYYWTARIKNFKNIARSRLIQSSSTSLINAGGGTAGLGASGLVFGSLSGQFLSTVALSRPLFNKKISPFKSVNWPLMKKEAAENKNFPLFSLPMGFLNSISGNIIVYVLTIFFTQQLVGFYSNAFRVINYPLNFISSSFTSVFYQKINETKNKVKIYLVSYFANLLAAVIILLPIIFWGDVIFAFILGAKWETAGTLAGIIAPLAIASFAMRSVSDVFSATKKNQILLLWQILYLLLAVIVIYLFRNASIEILLTYFTLIGSAMYFILAFSGFIILKRLK
jgi:O-antigen/teichoic acid export membrane protein